MVVARSTANAAKREETKEVEVVLMISVEWLLRMVVVKNSETCLELNLRSHEGINHDIWKRFGSEADPIELCLALCPQWPFLVDHIRSPN
jgi:hypothetical protein